jgi:hypothetical protein
VVLTNFYSKEMVIQNFQFEQKVGINFLVTVSQCETVKSSHQLELRTTGKPLVKFHARAKWRSGTTAVSNLAHLKLSNFCPFLAKFVKIQNYVTPNLFVIIS